VNPPLAQAFAHRDDEHPEPLWDALSAGFRHVEMDVWHLFGRLLVAHDPQGLRPGRTFERLYLAPLATAYETGRLAPDDPVWLYVDVKTRARSAHGATERLARRYPRWIARPGRDGDAAPIRLVLTGNRPPLDDLLADRDGACHYDGRLPDLGRPRDARWMPTVSGDWSRFSRWRGEGPMPDADLERLRAAVAATRAAGQRLRFWATPERPGPARDRVWTTLLDEGVDLLNTDDLAGLAAFLRDRQRGAPVSSSSSA
jgi:hypothetical protein